MMNARGIARLGVLTVGWGIGAAVASVPGIASADSSADWWPSIDNLVGGLSMPAQASGLDFQISIDGHDLLPTADNTATAFSSPGDIAIAYGDGAGAIAASGDGDFAEAVGTNASAVAAGGNFDTAINLGDNAMGPLPSDGAYANGTSDPGSFDTAIDIGNNNQVWATDGNGDVASVIANNSNAYAGGDYFNQSVTGNNDVAVVLDPFGADGSEAEAGASAGVNGVSGNNDVAADLFMDGYINGAGVEATGADDLVDVNGNVLSDLLGESAASASATGGNLLADLLSLF